jgi:polyisoprenoid-binding protein YceI
MRSLVIAFALATAATVVGTHAIAQDAPAAAPAAAQVRAGAYALDKAHAKIIWSTSHFGFSTYYGEFTDFDAKLNLDPANPANSKLSVTVQTASVNGHNPALEKHLQSADFFNVAQHPTATFVSTKVQPTSATTADVTGDFTLLGVTKPLTLKVTFNKAGENMAKTYVAGFSAEGVVKRSEFGMNYAVPGVSDDVKLLISGEFNPAA